MKFGEYEYPSGYIKFMKKEGINLLKPYIELIENNKIKGFTQICLENAPEYFWVIPAAISKNRHPSFARELGGTVKHSAVATYFAEQLCRAYGITEIVRDYILCAVLLHDTCKRGVKKYDMDYFPIHSLLPRLRYNKYQLRGRIGKKSFNEIMRLIESHMGDVSVDYVKKTKTLISKDMDLSQQIVYLADYISSRPKLNFEGIK